MATFYDTIILLQQYGITDVLLPFLLVFTLVFAILQKAKILGDKKNFNVILALVMALAVVIPHVTGTYPANADVVNIINTALPNISVGIVAIIMLMLLIGIWGETNFKESKVTGWMILLAFIYVAFVFISAYYAPYGGIQLPYWLYFLEDPGTQALVVVVLVFFAIIAFITREPQANKPSALSRLGDEFRKMLK